MSTISTANVPKHATAVPAFSRSRPHRPDPRLRLLGRRQGGESASTLLRYPRGRCDRRGRRPGWAVPRGLRNPDGLTAIVLAGAAVVSLGIFWLGLTAVIATGAILVGVAGWNGPRHPSLQRVAVAVALACLGFAALALVPVLG